MNSRRLIRRGWAVGKTSARGLQGSRRVMATDRQSHGLSNASANCQRDSDRLRPLATTLRLPQPYNNIRLPREDYPAQLCRDRRPKLPQRLRIQLGYEVEKDDRLDSGRCMGKLAFSEGTPTHRIDVALKKAPSLGIPLSRSK